MQIKQAVIESARPEGAAQYVGNGLARSVVMDLICSHRARLPPLCKGRWVGHFVSGPVGLFFRGVFCSVPTGGRGGNRDMRNRQACSLHGCDLQTPHPSRKPLPSPQGEGSRSPWRASRSYEPESVPAKTSQPLSQPTADSSPYTGEPMGCAEKYFPALMSRGSFTVSSVVPTPGTGNIRIRDCPNAPQKKQKTAAEAAAFCFGEIERIYAGRKRESSRTKEKKHSMVIVSECLTLRIH